MKKPKDWTFLYVPSAERGEALFCGAAQIEGDARYVVPNPLPHGVKISAFDKWRTEEARFRWCLEMVTGVLGESATRMKAEARARHVARKKAEQTGETPDFDGIVPVWDFLEALGRGAGPNDRVYLFVPAQDTPKMRGIEGVAWDRRKRLYYATRQADLNALFKYLTPSAQQAWAAARTGIRATDFLVQEMAIAEVNRRRKGSSGGTETSKENQSSNRPASTGARMSAEEASAQDTDRASGPTGSERT